MSSNISVWKLDKREEKQLESLHNLPIYYNQLPFLIRVINRTSPKSILEIGCARNLRLIGALAQLFEIDILMALDLSINVLLDAKKVSKGAVELIRADAGNLPLRDDSIDLVISSEMIEYLPKPNSMILEVNRTLIDSGVFFLSLKNAIGASRFFLWIYAMVRRTFVDLRLLTKKTLQLDERKNYFMWAGINRLIESRNFEIDFCISETGILVILENIMQKLGAQRRLQNSTSLFYLDIILARLFPRLFAAGWTLVCRNMTTRTYT